MKFLLLILLAVTASAQVMIPPGALVSSRVPVSGGAAAYDFTETFDANPGNNGYDSAGWTESSALINPDYTTSPAPLEGAESVQFGNASRTLRRSWTPSGTIQSMFFIYRWSTWDGSAGGSCGFLNGGTSVCRMSSQATSGRVILEHGTTGSTFFTTSANTTYYIWLEYTVGTGADGVANLYISTTTTKPAATLSIANGNGTLSATTASVDPVNASDILDRVIIHNGTIGSNP